MGAYLRSRDLAALDAACAALLDVTATPGATADRLLAALGPSLGIESVWGVAPSAGVPTPFADVGSTDFVTSAYSTADLLCAEVRPRERAAAALVARILSGGAQATFHAEELPRLVGTDVFEEFRRTAMYQAFLTPGRAVDLTGFVSGPPAASASLCCSRRTPDRPARRARATAALALLAPAFRARTQLGACVPLLGVPSAGVAGGLDLLPNPALLVDAENREVYRNAALRRRLTVPGVQADALLHAMRQAALSVRDAARAAEEGAGVRGRSSMVATLTAAQSRGMGPEIQAVLTHDDAARPGVLVVYTDRGLSMPAATAGALAAAAGVLTRREQEVALLLGERRTNAEIAAALGLSLHTVRRHVERVLQKLGVASRRDVYAALEASRDFASGSLQRRA